jgi:hypothetical protein
VLLLPHDEFIKNYERAATTTTAAAAAAAEQKPRLNCLKICTCVHIFHIFFLFFAAFSAEQGKQAAFTERECTSREFWRKKLRHIAIEPNEGFAETKTILTQPEAYNFHLNSFEVKL